MRIWWCQEHDAPTWFSDTTICSFAKYGPGYDPTPCRMVAMRLIPDNAETEELMAQAIGRNQWEELPVSDKDMNAFRSDVKAILVALDGVTP